MVIHPNILSFKKNFNFYLLDSKKKKTFIGESKWWNTVRTHLNKWKSISQCEEKKQEIEEDRTKAEGYWRLTDTGKQQRQWYGVAVTDTPVAFREQHSELRQHPALYQ